MRKVGMGVTENGRNLEAENEELKKANAGLEAENAKLKKALEKAKQKSKADAGEQKEVAEEREPDAADPGAPAAE
ncbi:MAG: hypothetical protein NC123_16745 [Butyrivibrio sp.]|nr:hypothetical protein [Acetatifactor muris]MCM1561166.1 hypothetical protein [Butyrivibrio sp.]